MQMQWRLLVAALALVVFAAFAVTLSSPATAQDDGSGNPVGSWIGTICPAAMICPTGSPIDFTDLLSINLGGTLTGTNGDAHKSQEPFLPPVFRVDDSDFFGVWKPIEHHQAAATLKWLIFLGPNQLDPAVTAIWCPGTTCAPGPFPGQNIGAVTLETVVTLQHAKNGDTLTGPYTIQYTNLNGEWVVPSSGIMTFSRIAIEPLATP
jgi:hypothetical protein